MRTLVTGCAGFVGSTLTDRLLHDGYDVISIDRFSDYHSRGLKEQNLSRAMVHPRFTLLEEDILDVEIFSPVDYVFHLAAQAGVRASWGKGFEVYTRDNVQATPRLLECYKNAGIKKFVYSSSSSVYGDVDVHAAINHYLHNKDFGMNNSEWVNNGDEFSNIWFKPTEVYFVDEKGSKISGPITNDEDIWIVIEGDVSQLDIALTIGYAIFNNDGLLLYWFLQTDQNERLWPKLFKGKIN